MADSVSVLSIIFSITSDDKEHQDAVAVEVTDKAGLKVFDQEIVPATGDDGDGDDQNKYYWPSDGPGKHPHLFVLPLSSPIGEDEFVGSKIKIASYTYGGHGDFESWIASVTVTAYLTPSGQKRVRLDGSDSQVVNWQNSGSPGPYTFTMSLA
jgi:hypothetical protein